MAVPDELQPGALPLDLSSAQRVQLAQAAIGLLERLLQERDTAPIFVPTPHRLIEDMLAPPCEIGTPLPALVDRLGAAASAGWSKAHAGDLAFIPSGGIFSGAVAAFLAAGVHAFTGASFEAPGLVAIEESVLRWLAGIFGLPARAEGILLSGGSMANQTAIVCARRRGFDAERSRVYLSERAHHSLHKALHLSGIPDRCVRPVATNGSSSIDVDALSGQLERDCAAGLKPWLIVGVAGSTDTGAVDALEALAALAVRYGAWLHVDAAYGGMFALTERGALRLKGIAAADSITVDAHKGLMLPYGVAALLVRHPGALAEAHAGSGNYLRDVPELPGLPHYFQRGPELTRPYRGLLVWWPLQLHGVAAYRRALDRSLDLAVEAARRLQTLAGIDVVNEPELSIVAFKASRGDVDTEAILAALNDSGRLHVSSTRLDGSACVRLAFLHPKTGLREIDAVLQICAATLQAQSR